jgi:CubicO group peptidase (beta-lactamase class C family)
MKAIDAFVQRLAAADRFAGVVLVAKNDKVIFEKAYGLADRSFGVPNTSDTRFNIGSIDKTFTAIAAARLVEQGKLSYEDPLSKFIDFPDAETAGKIKLKHLLSHTSGLGDYITPAFDEIRTSLSSLDEYMKLTEKLKPMKLSFEPGEGWGYSNLGMLLVGRIIEKVTGEDYYDHIQKVIFDKAGMSTATDLHLGEIKPNVATLYEVSFPEGRLNWRNASYELPARSAPDGGSVATARDFAKFAAALRSGMLVKPETFALMAASKDELGTKGRYGFGIANMNQRLGARGRDVIGHGGDTNGACASFGMVRDAAAPYTIVVLSNSFQGSCFPVGEAVLEMIPAAPSTVRPKARP